MAREDCVTALDEFVGALEIDPTNSEAHSQLGYLFSLYGKNEEAIRYYADSLRLSDDPKMIAEAGRRVEALRRATERKSENE